MTVKDISGTATPGRKQHINERIDRLSKWLQQGTLPMQNASDIRALIDAYNYLYSEKAWHDAEEAVADQKRLVEFFRDHPGWGAYGDEQKMTPGQCAMHFLTEYANELPRLTRAEEVKSALNTPRTDADFEMMQRRAVVGEEPYHSPSVDPSEFTKRPPLKELIGAAKYITDNEVWLEVAKVSLRLGNSGEVAAGVASEMLSAYRQAVAAGLDLRKKSQT